MIRLWHATWSWSHIPQHYNCCYSWCLYCICKHYQAVVTVDNEDHINHANGTHDLVAAWDMHHPVWPLLPLDISYLCLHWHNSPSFEHHSIVKAPQMLHGNGLLHCLPNTYPSEICNKFGCLARSGVADNNCALFNAVLCASPSWLLLCCWCYALCNPSNSPCTDQAYQSGRIIWSVCCWTEISHNQQLNPTEPAVSSVGVECESTVNIRYLGCVNDHKSIHGLNCLRQLGEYLRSQQSSTSQNNHGDYGSQIMAANGTVCEQSAVGCSASSPCCNCTAPEASWFHCIPCLVLYYAQDTECDLLGAVPIPSAMDQDCPLLKWKNWMGRMM